MTTYVEPHAPLRNAVVAVALLLIVGGVLLKVYARYQEPPSGPPEEVIRFVASQARLAAIFFTGVFAAFWCRAVAYIQDDHFGYVATYRHANSGEIEGHH